MDIRALHRQGLTYAEIGRMLGRDWRTVKRYLEEDVQPSYRRKRRPSILDPYKPLVDQWLAREPRLTATRIHQDLARDYGFPGCYQVVRRYVERARPRDEPRAEERFETAPGHQAQVDWSQEAPLVSASGLELPLYAFHMVLGHSRDGFCRFTGSTDLVSFWACHRAAFAHFGGVPRELLYDRTKTVVRTHVGKGRDGESRLHPEALASALHYGFRIRLCQPYRAKTKGKVESDVAYVRERLARGHAWRSYEEANAAWAAWDEEIARMRIHRTHGERVATRATRDRAALLALPERPYLVCERTTRIVARDGFFSFEGHRNAVRGARPGERVELRLGAEELEVFRSEGELLGRYRRGQPARVLPDPAEDSLPLAQVLEALPDPEVHRRSLSVYEEVLDG